MYNCILMVEAGGVLKMILANYGRNSEYHLLKLLKQKDPLDLKKLRVLLLFLLQNFLTFFSFTFFGYLWGYKQKNPLRGQRKVEEKSEEKLLQDLYGTWPLAGSSSVKYENQLAHPVGQSSPSSVHSQQRQFPKSEMLQYQQISNSFVTPSAYGNLTNPYPAMPVLSHMQPGEFKHQSLSSCYNVSSGKTNHVNKSAAAPAKSLTMTPQEKIEKLRRRQQMQAMLAIQKQQQQFNQQVSRDHSNPQNFQENQIQLVEGADLEVGDLSALPSFDPNSPVEQDDSNTICLAVDNNAVADTILFRLQDVIAQVCLIFFFSFYSNYFISFNRNLNSEIAKSLCYCFDSWITE